MSMTFEICGQREVISSFRRAQIISKDHTGKINSIRELYAEGFPTTRLFLQDKESNRVMEISKEEATLLLNSNLNHYDIFIIQHEKNKEDKVQYAYYCNIGSLSFKMIRLLDECITVLPDGTILFSQGQCGEWKFNDKRVLLYNGKSTSVRFSKDATGLLTLSETSDKKEIYPMFHRDLLNIFMEKLAERKETKNPDITVKENLYETYFDQNK